MQIRNHLLFFGALAFSLAAGSFGIVSAYACDLCAIYASVDSRDPANGQFHIGVAEQFTYFGTVRDNGKKVVDDHNQNLKSFVTQVFGSYDLSNDFSVQANLPVIDRRYYRPEGDVMERGNESGIGDMSVLLLWSPLQFRNGQSTASVQVFSGLKLPTGDGDRLREELSMDHHSGDEIVPGEDDDHSHEDHFGHVDAFVARHGGGHDEDGMVSAIHGHDLALGSGSVDIPFGLASHVTYSRLLAEAQVQYMLRTRGQYDYEYGDDFLWSGGLGGYVYLEHDSSVALKVALSGEYKRKDSIGSETFDDTGMRSVFWGPEVAVSLDSGFTADLGVDFPLDVNTSDVQITPDYRMRAALSYRF